MIALFFWISTALSAPFVSCDPPIKGAELAVGMDLAQHSGASLRPQFDVMATWPVWSCFRAGARVYEATEGSLTMWDGEQYLAAFIKTHGAVGAEVHFPLDLTLAGYALVGAKTVSVLQRQGDDRYHVVQWSPSVYAYAALRWRPTARFGMHLDLAIPLNDIRREKDWYANRVVGIGVDFRLGRKTEKR